MAFAFKNHAGTVLTTTVQTLLTFASGLVTGGAVVQAISAIVVGSTNRVVTIYLIPSGQAAADQYIIFRDTIPANTTFPIPGGPWFADSAAFVQAKQDAGTDVTLRTTAFEES